jgi:hypothetical protein
MIAPGRSSGISCPTLLRPRWGWCATCDIGCHHLLRIDDPVDFGLWANTSEARAVQAEGGDQLPGVGYGGTPAEAV